MERSAHEPRHIDKCLVRRATAILAALIGNIEGAGKSVNFRDNHRSEKRYRVPNRFLTTSVSISLTVVLALAGVFVFLIYGARVETMLVPAVFSLSYQFLLIVVMGGAVSLLYKEFSSERDRTRERRAILREMHSELLKAFNDAKRVRRNLRARIGCLTDDGVAQELIVNAADYREQMDILMGAQLTFEVYAKRAEDHELYFAHGEELRTECKKVEEYLNQIISEYEEKLTSFAGVPPCKALVKLPKLAEFIGPFENAEEFKFHFKIAFKAVLSALTRASLT